jgi:hypothetical protein
MANRRPDGRELDNRLVAADSTALAMSGSYRTIYCGTCTSADTRKRDGSLVTDETERMYVSTVDGQRVYRFQITSEMMAPVERRAK